MQETEGPYYFDADSIRSDIREDRKGTRLRHRASGVTREAAIPLAAQNHGLTSGGGGIRTLGALARTTVFETAPFNRSGTPPGNCREEP